MNKKERAHIASIAADALYPSDDSDDDAGFQTGARSIGKRLVEQFKLTEEDLRNDAAYNLATVMRTSISVSSWKMLRKDFVAEDNYHWAEDENTLAHEAILEWMSERSIDDFADLLVTDPERAFKYVSDRISELREL